MLVHNFVKTEVAVNEVHTMIDVLGPHLLQPSVQELSCLISHVI